MNILFLTSRFPYPPHRGDKLKIYNLLKRLSRKHTITLLSFVSGRRDLSYVGEIEKLGVRVETVVLPKWRSLMNSLLALPGSEPLQVRYYTSRRMRARLRALLEERRYDLVHIHLIRMAQYGRSGEPPVRILDLTDAGSLYLERFYRTTRNPVKKYLLGIELGRLRRYESVIGEFSASLVCSAVDREVLADRADGATIAVLPNGIDLSYFTPDPARRYDPRRIIYTGNLSYFPNSDGVIFFVREVFPLIRKVNPGVTLYIVGKDPPGSVRGLASTDIVVTGFVEDIRGEYLRSSLAVAPIRFGAGTLNKVLEPMALGIPVVATSVGAEGLSLEPGRHLLVADTAPEFASCVNRLLADERLRSELAENAMRVVRARYDWDMVTDSLDEIYRECTGEGRRS
jgi:sugar transferase (PEP-CTERM/EpsH1 system associated)